LKIHIRKDRMNKWERWDAILNRKPTDRVPVWSFGMGFTALYSGLSIVDAYTNPAKVMEAVAKVCHDFGWQDLPLMGYAAMGAWEFGGDVKMPSGEFAQAPMVIRKPVETPEDIDKLPAPDVKTAGIVPLMMEGAKLQIKGGAPLTMPMSLAAWSLAGNIAGIDTMCKWSLKKPELVHKICKKVYPFSVDILRYWVDTFGSDRLLPYLGGTAAASNQLISADQFGKFVFPYLRDLYNDAKAMGIKHFLCHICGEQNANLPHLAKLDFGDPGIVTFGHEVKLETAAKFFSGHIIAGNLEPAIIQTKTPEEVYQAVRVVIEKGKELVPQQYLFAPGCEMPPKAPIDNIWALMQAVSDVGWYE